MNKSLLGEEALFLGRDDEQQRFRSLLDNILNASYRGFMRKRSPLVSEWSYVVLLYGTGGMGKTTLSKRLRDIALGSPPDRRYHNKFTTLWLDWEVAREQDRRLAVRDAITFEVVLGHLYNAFRRNGFIREFNRFEEIRIHLREIEIYVDQTLGSHIEDVRDNYGSLRELGSKGLAILVREKIPAIDTFFSQEETAHAMEDIFRIGTEGLESLRRQASEWLRHHLKADEHNLFTSPHENLAHAFAQGIQMATRSRPLIIFLDTYEVIDKIDPSLRLIMAQSGRHTVWMLAGRNNLLESRRYGQHYFLGYQGQAMAERLRAFPMSEFSQDDITAYFNEKASTRTLTSEEASRVQHATYGIPLAVKTAATLWARGASLETLVEGIPESADRETIIKTMTDRLLVHARADPNHSQDVQRLYALALMYQPDYDLLAALWEDRDVRQVLDNMERQYEFVFAYDMRLHEVVRDFLREYLLADVERRSPMVQSINKRAVSHLEKRLRDYHSHLQTLEDRLEDEDWVAAVLALTWHRLWLDEKLVV